MLPVDDLFTSLLARVSNLVRLPTALLARLSCLLARTITATVFSHTQSCTRHDLCLLVPVYGNKGMMSVVLEVEKDFLLHVLFLPSVIDWALGVLGVLQSRIQG